MDTMLALLTLVGFMIAPPMCAAMMGAREAGVYAQGSARIAGRVFCIMGAVLEAFGRSPDRLTASDRHALRTTYR